MKEDRDLQFLASCKSEDLKTLVDMMTSDKDGNIRTLTCGIISTVCLVCGRRLPTSCNALVEIRWSIFAAEGECLIG